MMPRCTSTSISNSATLTPTDPTAPYVQQLRETPWADFSAARDRGEAPASAAEARVDTMLQEAQEASVQTVAGAPRTTRAGRAPRGAAAAVAEPPATTGRTRRGGAAAAAQQQPVPKFEEPPAEAAAGGAIPEEDDAENAPAGPSEQGGNANENQGKAGGAAAVAAAGGAEARAQAKIDAKLAAIGGAAGARRTVARGALMGEALFSANGARGGGVRTWSAWRVGA
jgi:hypothetical protein